MSLILPGLIDTFHGVKKEIIAARSYTVFKAVKHLAALIALGVLLGSYNTAAHPAPAANKIRQIIRLKFLPDTLKKWTFIPHQIPFRARIGLALSGGGSRAIAQIGVLQVLEEHHIPIDYIVGTSMGSIIGGLYAAGYSPDELVEIVKSIEWESILNDKPPRRSLFIGKKQEQDRLLLQIRLDGLKPYIPPALTPGQRLQNVLTQLTLKSLYASSQSFDEFRIPFRAISTDLYSGQKVVLSQGDLAEAMRASLAFPLLFTPVPLNGKLLADGGLVDNIPVDEVKKFPVDLVIAVDATSNLRKEHQLNAPWEIADQVTTIMQRDRNEQSRNMADFLIRLEDDARVNTDFSNLDSLILMGRNEARKIIPQLLQKLKEIEARAYPALPGGAFTFQQILIENQPGGPDFRPVHTNGTPVTLTSHQIIAMLKEMYLQGDYRDIYALLTGDSTSYKLKIVTKPNPILQKIRIIGNSVFPLDTLQKMVRPLLHRPLNPVKTRSVAQALIRAYRNAGFSLARIIDMSYDESSGLGTIVFDEGVIRQINGEGNIKTKSHVILREFSLKEGDIFNSIKAQQGIDNIFATGLFHRVTLSVTQKRNGLLLTIKVQEKKYHTLGISFRFDSERKSRGFFELANDNFLGLGALLALQNEWGSRDREIRAKFSIERIFKTYLTLNVQAYWNWQQNYVYLQGERFPIGEYSQNQFGTFISIGQLMRKLGVVTAELHFDRFDISPVSGYGYPTRITVINRLTLRSIVDTRDELPYPFRGRYVHLYYDFGNKRLKSDHSFFRFYARLESYNTLNRRNTVHFRFMFGTSDLTTPFQMQFRVGGPDQFYALRDKEWIGRHFVIFSAGYRYFIPSRLPFKTFLGLRFDIGGAWQSPEDTNYKRVRQAIGTYIALDTLLGTMEFSYGRLDTGQNRIYFSLGYKF